jgi:predicted PurR-regulated permease PerM
MADIFIRRRPMPSSSEWAWFRRVLGVLVLLGLAALISQIIAVVFIAFGASLLSVLLCWLTSFLQRQIPLRRPLALGVVILILAVAFAAAVWLFGTTLTAQFGQVAQALPESLRHIHQELLQTDWGRLLASQLQQINVGSGNFVERITGIVGSAFGLLADFALIGVAGIYLAAEPELYLEGILQLVPTPHLTRARQVMDAVGEALRLWIAGQLFAMVVVGIMWSVSLWALGVGSALALGVIAGLAEFVPVIGPIVGAVPAVIIALAQSPALALWAVVVYFIIQQIESSLLMPLIQARVVSLPPTITLFAMVTCGLLFGILGVLFAMPLAVAMMVLVRMLYVEDVLGKRPRSGV